MVLQVQQELQEQQVLLELLKQVHLLVLQVHQVLQEHQEQVDYQVLPV